MAYSPYTWQDNPSGGTPITAARLNAIEQGIYNAAATADAGQTVYDYLNVKMVGAKGDGTTDDTTAIDSAFTSARPSAVYFPPGNYIYNGNGWSGSRPWIIGAGQTQTQITLGSSSYLINYGYNPSATWLSGVKVQGGLGAIYYSNTSQSNSEYHTVRDCYFSGYANTAIMDQSTDMPNWTIENNIFYGANDTTTMGIALGDLHNGSLISHNEFRRNRVGIKLRNGQDIYVINNAFERWNVQGSQPRTDVWLVPYSSYSNAHTGFTMRDNKLGNEFMAAGDYRILIADELTGSDISQMWPNLTSNSGGNVRSARFDNMLYNTDGTNTPYIYSTANALLRNYITYDDGFTTAPTYYVQYRTAPATEQGNVYKRSSTQNTVLFSNATTITNLAA